MASDERNALAELAETLKYHIEPRRLNADKDEFAVACCKALRIIAELAKVQDGETALFQMKYINPDEARRIVRQREGNCILKCRAIAEEEGAKE